MPEWHERKAGSEKNFAWYRSVYAKKWRFVWLNHFFVVFFRILKYVKLFLEDNFCKNFLGGSDEIF